MLKNMREYEISGIILAAIIIVMIIMVAIKSPTLEHVLLAGLIGVTTWYAYSTIKIARATKQQADASVKMAEEMKKQRYDTVRPVIDIQMEESPDAHISRGLADMLEDTSWGLSCILYNIGLGPAIDVCSFVQPPTGNRWCKNFGTIARDRGTEPINLSPNQEGDRKVLVAYYKDVYGNPFESIREVSVDKDKGAANIGPLKVRPLPKKEHTDD